MMETTTQPSRSTARLVTVAALVVAVAGILVQIIAGTDYPVVPPGIIILLVAALITWFGPWRWAPVVGALAGLSQVIGLFAAGQADRLTDLDPVADTLGIWVQLLAVATATVAGVVAAVLGRVSE